MVEEEKKLDIRPGISQEQKVGLFLLFVFALLAVSLGVLQIRNTIYGPFALKDTVPNITPDTVNTVEALQLRDTDKDGLTDFDELYIYGTSPYLADTDSDGISDSKEIESGKNPLCPEGSQCGGLSDETSDAERGALASLKILGIDPNPDFGEEPIDLNTALNDPAQVKQLLIGTGVDAELLKGISDNELMAMVREIMFVSSTVNTEALDALKNLGDLNNLSNTNTKQ